MGKPLPGNIYQKQLRSAEGRGLDLARGPDPRSSNPIQGIQSGLPLSLRGSMRMDMFMGMGEN